MKKSIKNNTSTLVVTLLAASSIFVVIAMNSKDIPNDEAPKRAAPAPIASTGDADKILSKVSVQQTKTGTYQAQVIGYGEASSRFELDYTSEISGRVNWLAGNFEVGKQVTKGDLLATINDRTYQQLVAQAKADLAAAQLELLEEQREGEQARAQWQRSGLTGEPDSTLVFRQPQLASAQASVENAKRSLLSAQKDLAYADIRAPFDGVITAREIQPGAYVNVGGAIATLYSIDRVDIEIPLSQQQWKNLPSQADHDDLSAVVYDSSSNNQWSAVIERTHQYFDKTTRQRSLVLTVESPLATDKKLFPGMFLQAKITGKQLDNIWELPASALSQQGDIWIVSSQGLLNKFAVDVLFERGNKIYINPVTDSDTEQVVIRPLSNFNVGMKVSPQLVNKGEG